MAEYQNGWFEKHVVESLQRLEEGQNNMITKFETHEKSDAKQFEEIRTNIATAAASHEATAKANAKFWGIVGGAISLALSSAVHFMFKH